MGYRAIRTASRLERDCLPRRIATCPAPRTLLEGLEERFKAHWAEDACEKCLAVSG